MEQVGQAARAGKLELGLEETKKMEKASWMGEMAQPQAPRTPHRHYALWLAVAMLCGLLLLGGCGGKEEAEDGGNDAQTEDGEDVEVGTDEDGENGEDNATTVDGVTLGDYMGLEVSVPKSEVTDETVQSYIEELIARYPTYTATDKTTVEDGDFVDIDFEGLIDDEPFDNGSAEGYVLEIGSNTFIDGFEEGLVGANVGDTLALDLTFPENYGNEDFAGKPVVFNVTVNSIVEPETVAYDDLTDEYVKENFGAESVDDFLANTRTQLENNSESSEASNIRSAVIEKLGEICSAEVGDELLDERYAAYKEQFESMVKGYGMELSDYFEQQGTTEEEFDSQNRDFVKDQVEFELIMLAIAKQEGIEADEEGLASYEDSMARSYGYDSVDELEEDYGADYLRNTYVSNLALDKVVENAKVTYTDADEAEPEAPTGTVTQGEGPDASAGETGGTNSDAPNPNAASEGPGGVTTESGDSASPGGGDSRPVSGPGETN